MNIEVVTTAGDDTNENSGLGDGLITIPILYGLQKKYPDAKVVLKLRPHQWKICNVFWPNCEMEWKCPEGTKFDSKAELRLRTCSTGFWSSEDKLAKDIGLTRMSLIAKRFGVETCFDFKPLTPPDVHAEHVKNFDNFFFDKRKSPIVVICAAANQLCRKWQIDNFVWLAHDLMLLGYRVVFFGDIPNGYEMKLLKMNVMAFPKIPEDKLVSMIQAADMFIGNDSGLTHVAGLVGTKALAICGMSIGEVVFKDYASVTTLQAEKSCSGCLLEAAHGWKGACNLACRALLETPVSHVLKAALTYLEPIKTSTFRLVSASCHSSDAPSTLPPR